MSDDDHHKSLNWREGEEQIAATLGFDWYIKGDLARFNSVFRMGKSWSSTHRVSEWAFWFAWTILWLQTHLLLARNAVLLLLFLFNSLIQLAVISLSKVKMLYLKVKGKKKFYDLRIFRSRAMSCNSPTRAVRRKLCNNVSRVTFSYWFKNH